MVEPATGLTSRTFLPRMILLAAMLLLAACAAVNQGAGQNGATQDLVTESDEPDARKRARIRLQLALGYFEQGQTNIALDELKQALAADASYAEAYNLRGLIYMRLQDFRIAEDSFRRALQMGNRDPNVMHNLGWLMCQQARYPESLQWFTQVLSSPQYGERAKTFRAKGLCEARAGLMADAEQSLLKSYEYDAGNPVTAYNLADLLWARGDLIRAQFYIRRLNNSELANSESLWLGIKIERKLANQEAMTQLGTQLDKRFPQSAQASLYRRGAFDE